MKLFNELQNDTKSKEAGRKGTVNRANKSTSVKQKQTNKQTNKQKQTNKETQRTWQGKWVDVNNTGPGDT